MTEKVAADRLGHAVHQLSFWGRIVSFYRGDESNPSEILSRSLTFNREHNCFVDAEDVSVLYRTRAAVVDIVTCACVYDVQKRVTSPFILLRQGNKDGSYEYSLLGLSSSIKQETKVTFKLPYQLRDKVHIMHGPVVLWTHAGVGFYTSVLEKQDVAVVRPTPTCVSRPLMGVLPLHKGDVFIVGPMTSQFNKSFPKTEISGHKTTSQSRGCLLLSAGHFDATVMLPCAYIPITRTLLVLCAEKLNGVLVKSSLVAATSEKQLILFEDGVPKDVCQLPFDAPEDIHVVDTGRNGCLVTVCFDQGHACAIWKDSFQVAAHWSAVRSVHVDDFLGCGTEQLLLLFEDEDRSGCPEIADVRFLLTDLCGISLSNVQRNNMDAASEPAGHNQLLTFQALESRLQSGLTVVQDLQRDDRLKQKVLLQSIQALTDLVSGRDPVVTQPEQEGLFPLWDEEDPGAQVCDEGLQGSGPAGGGPSSRPRVERLWHRLTEDHLVVGATLAADSAVPVDCVSLSVLTNGVPGSAPTVIQTRSQVFQLASPSSPSPSPSSPSPDPPGPAAKRTKGDDDGGPHRTPGGPGRLAVTAVTPLTSLRTWGRVRCPVVLHYQGETPALDTPTPAAFQCGQVVVDIRADPHGRLLADPERTTEEDLLSALSVLDHEVFLLDSPHHSLGDVEHWMQKAACCKRLKVNPQYLVAHPEGPSAAMLLRWSPASMFQGRLSVHGSRLPILRFLERLSGFLLPSCTVRHLRGPGLRAGPRALALALENEALALKRAAASLLGGEVERRGGSGEERGGSGRRGDGDLRGAGLDPLPPVEVERYRSLTRRLTEVQLRADVAVLLQAGS